MSAIHFASDNYASVHPEVLEAMARVNVGHDTAYGADATTADFDAAVAQVFGGHAVGFPVFNGTGANVISLMALSPRWGGVVASELSHINVDENGAPERVGGLKILPVPAPGGKVQLGSLATYADNLGDEHRAQPVVLSLTQSTELGTVYSLDEMRALVDAAHAAGMRVHVDGARIANAAAALGVTLLEACGGADVVSLGGTKNGAMGAEAVVVLSEDLAESLAADLLHLRKATMQLGSKMRYMSAQLITLLGSHRPDSAPEADPLWLRNARHANQMATALREQLAPLAQDGIVRFTQPTQANAVFVEMPRTLATALREFYSFYDWQPGATPDSVEVRLMCAWDTPLDHCERFASRALTLASAV